MKGYRLRPAAEVDLDNIWNYTAITWSADQAERNVSGLFDAFASIADNPALGARVDLLREGYRRFKRGHHLIFCVIASGGEVEVIRALHESSDLPQHL
jgi:toxin ParE1/3/4